MSFNKFCSWIAFGNPILPGSSNSAYRKNLAKLDDIDRLNSLDESHWLGILSDFSKLSMIVDRDKPGTIFSNLTDMVSNFKITTSERNAIVEDFFTKEIGTIHELERLIELETKSQSVEVFNVQGINAIEVMHTDLINAFRCCDFNEIIERRLTW